MKGVENRPAQELFWQLASVAVFAIGMFFPQREVKLDKINICLGAMLLAFIGAWLLSMNGWEYVQNFIFGLLVYFTAIRTLDTNDLKFIIKGVMWMLVLATAWLLLQKIGFDVRGTIIRNTIKPGRNSFFFHPSSMGMYFAGTIPLVLSMSWVGILLLPVIKFSECSAAYLGIIGAVLFYYWFRKRVVFWILFPLMIAIGIYSVQNRESFTGVEIRLPLWKNLTHKIMQCPVGHGLKSFIDPQKAGQSKFYVFASNKQLLEMVRTDKGNFVAKERIYFKPSGGETHFYDHPHNEYMWLGYDVGLHGLVILGFLYYFIWQRFSKSRKGHLEVAFTASLLAFSLMGLGQFPLFLSRVGHLLPVIFAGFMITTEEP